MNFCPDGQPHRRLVEGRGYEMRGTCRRCGDVQTYAFTLEDMAWKRWEYRKDKTTPAVSAMGGTV